MTVALGAVAVIAFGLPLGAFWLGGRRFWGRLRSRSLPGDRQGALYREMVLRHRLRPAEIPQVEGAVSWGRRLEDPRLRAAVVDWAEAMAADATRRRALHPRRRRVLLAALALWLSCVVAATTLGIVAGDWGTVLRTVGYALLLGGPGYLAERGPCRAIERNTDPPPGPSGAGVPVDGDLVG